MRATLLEAIEYRKECVVDSVKKYVASQAVMWEKIPALARKIRNSYVYSNSVSDAVYRYASDGYWLLVGPDGVSCNLAVECASGFLVSPPDTVCDRHRRDEHVFELAADLDKLDAAEIVRKLESDLICRAKCRRDTTAGREISGADNEANYHPG